MSANERSFIVIIRNSMLYVLANRSKRTAASRHLSHPLANVMVAFLLVICGLTSTILARTKGSATKYRLLP